MHMHAHDDEQSTYYLDQLCTIGICGALAVVLILAYVHNALGNILSPKFHQPVLWGGLTLLFLVVVRAVAIWIASGKCPPAEPHTHAADHEHEHSHECGHDHAHEHTHAVTTEPHGHAHAACGHEHAHAHEHDDATADDHGHEHGWAPWRYAVLLLPVVLYFLGIPAAPAYEDEPDQTGIPELSFTEVERAAYTPETRQYWENQYKKDEKGRLIGKFAAKSADGTAFSLYRNKISCCAADAVPLKIVILSKVKLPVDQLEGSWVRVIGKISFHKAKDRDEYFTVLEAESVQKMDRPPANQYVF